MRLIVILGDFWNQIAWSAFRLISFMSHCHYSCLHHLDFLGRINKPPWIISPEKRNWTKKMTVEILQKDQEKKDEGNQSKTAFTQWKDPPSVHLLLCLKNIQLDHQVSRYNHVLFSVICWKLFQYKIHHSLSLRIQQAFDIFESFSSSFKPRPLKIRSPKCLLSYLSGRESRSRPASRLSNEGPQR